MPPAFAALGLEETLLKALAKMGWTAPTEVQEKMIPVALSGRDILGQARTGTGKTAAFALPILQRLGGGGHPPAAAGVGCLVLAPTRELAAQVADEIQRLGRFTPHHVLVAYGGTRIREQAEQLKRHPAIVVGTPGRIMDLMGRGMLRLDQVRFAVLDEVDRMLDIGFRDDIRKILSAVSSQRQTIFVSATISDEINRLGRTYMNDPVEIFCTPDKLTVDEVDQCCMTVQQHDKRRLLVHVIGQEKPEQCLVFTRTKRETARLAKTLKDAGINAAEIHGDLFQTKRERIMRSFRKGHLRVLVATDLASRGIDVDDISHVINVDIPEDPEVYVHRIGRTARMGAKGKAITFVCPDQGQELTEIEMLIDKLLPNVKPEGFEPSPPREDAGRGRPGARKEKRPRIRGQGGFKPRRR